MTVAGQPTVNYTYDDTNRLTQITQGAATVVIGYDNANRRTSLTLPNGVLVEYGYDQASRLTSINYSLGGTPLGNLTYEYDKAGNRTKVGGSWARTALPAAVTAGTYDAANRTSSFGGQAITYDNNGNITSFGADMYSWNARNQLSTISGGASATFVYDGLGRRMQKTIGAAPTEFLYDGVNPVQEKDGGTVLANILTGLGVDEYFTRSIPSTPTETRHLLADALGSTVALTNDTGAAQTQYTYEPFGKTTVTDSPSTNSFQFTGRENDGTDLYYYRARYYHPILQRFISEDPILHAGNPNVPYMVLTLLREPADLHGYAYVNNSALNFTDPLGLLEKCIPWLSRQEFEGRGSLFWRLRSVQRIKNIPFSPATCWWDLVQPGYNITIPQKRCFDTCNPRKGFYRIDDPAGLRTYELAERIIRSQSNYASIILPAPGMTGDIAICEPP